MTPETFPAPVYADTVLAPNFEEAKKNFLESLLDIHYAHTRMLATQGIISRDDEKTLIAALDRLDRVAIAKMRYSGAFEDLFFYIESLLIEFVGPDTAGKMHTARSRNDIDITLFRMTVRRELIDIAIAIAEARSVLLDLASRNLETVMPAHTHTQPAQPTTLAHYLLAATEFMARDVERIQGAFTRVNLNPLGACAITTTGFPIDRFETAKLLGFEGLAENSYGAIGAVDYLTESAAAVAVAMVDLSKLTQDFLLWSTREFGFLRLSNAFVQSSSIMPQKRNPVALEHVRILASKALGQAQAVLTCAHNTPFGDINDSEDDVQPLITTMFEDALRSLRLLAGAMRTAEVDRDLLEQRARQHFLTVTELADTMVRREGMSFRQAHGLVAKTVKACGSHDDAETIADTLMGIAPSLKLSRAEILEALDPVHFVQIRNVIGGPSPATAAAALERARQQQHEIEAWARTKTIMLDDARAKLYQR